MNIRAVLSIFLLYTAASLSLAQGQFTSLVDSLQEEIKNNRDDKAVSSQLYYNIGRYYYRRNHDSASVYLHRSLSTAQEANSPYHIIQGLQGIGNLYADLGNLDSSFQFLERASTLLNAKESSLNDSLILQLKYSVTSSLSRNYYNTGRYDKGFENGFHSLTLAREMDNAYEISKSLYNIGIVKNQIGESHEAIPFLKESIREADRSEQGLLMAFSRSGLASVYQSMGLMDSAALYLQSAINLDLKNIPAFALYEPYKSLALLSLEHKTPKGLIYYLSKADSLAQNVGGPEQLMDLTCIRAAYHVVKEEYKTAKSIFVKWNDLVLQHPEVVSKTTFCLENWIHSEKKLNNLDQALLLTDRLMTIKDSIFNTERSQFKDELETKYEVNKIEQSLLEQKLTTAKRTSQRNTLLISSIFIFILGAFALFYQRQRNSKNKLIAQKESKISQQRISELEKEKKINNMSSMIEGQEAERRRIAKDLHDGLGGLLTSVRAKLTQLQTIVDEISSLNIYESANEMIDQACDEVRRITHNMMPGVLRIEGLQGAIEDIADQLQHIHALKVEVEFNFDPTQISESQAHMIYRIVQEACNNIIKHSQATEVFIQAIDYEDHLNIVIEDNGIGYKQSNTNKGLGLSSITARVDFLNGTIDTSTSADGTSISINIPLNIPNNANSLCHTNNDEL